MTVMDEATLQKRRCSFLGVAVARLVNYAVNLRVVPPHIPQPESFHPSNPVSLPSDVSVTLLAPSLLHVLFYENFFSEY